MVTGGAGRLQFAAKDPAEVLTYVQGRRGRVALGVGEVLGREVGGIVKHRCRVAVSISVSIIQGGGRIPRRRRREERTRILQKSPGDHDRAGPCDSQHSPGVLGGLYVAVDHHGHISASANTAVCSNFAVVLASFPAILHFLQGPHDLGAGPVVGSAVVLVLPSSAVHGQRFASGGAQTPGKGDRVGHFVKQSDFCRQSRRRLLPPGMISPGAAAFGRLRRRREGFRAVSVDGIPHRPYALRRPLGIPLGQERPESSIGGALLGTSQVQIYSSEGIAHRVVYFQQRLDCLGQYRRIRSAQLRDEG
mmetsp:Transcript_29222/g.86529  ORF Transcript_29222/g.86529 Transcript_29222/m.86529 type:complete len:305 (-) Transcript_29222:375-1289(-)